MPVGDLVGAFRDGRTDASTSQAGTNGAGGIRFVGQHPVGPTAGPPGGSAGHADRVQHRAENRGVGGIAWRHNNGQGQAATIDGQMDLKWSARPGTGRGPAPPPSVAEFPVCPCQGPFFTGSIGVLVSPVDGGVHRHRPIHAPHGVIPDLDMLQQLGPGAIGLPAGEAFVGGLPGPYLSGRSRHGAPVRNRHNTPSIT